MATDDENKEPGAEGEGRQEGRRGAGRNRGERSSTGGGGRAPSNREIEAAIANLPHERLAALLSIGQARAGRPTTPKISQTLDKLDAEKARDVIAACDEAIEYYREQERNREAPQDDQALAPIRDVDPEVVAAIFRNSGYRNKSIRHSVEATRRYLAAKHGDDTQTDAEAVG